MTAPRTIALLLAFAGACASHAHPPVGSPPAASNELAARIARVENGLVPEVRVAGEPARWSIADRLRAHHTPGVSIAIIHDYQVAWAKAYGFANAATREPMTEATRMQAASISKLVTALAALKEVEAGKLSLDSDVNRSLRSWQLPESALTRATPVTLRQLLSHSAGTNVHGFLGFAPNQPLPTLRELLEGKPPATNAAVRVELAPGKQFAYSGGGLSIVQQLLIDVEGRSFPAILDATVFAPLGLSHSTFEQPAVGAGGPLAAGHDFDGTPIFGERERHAALAAAGLWTTPRDLAQLLVELQRALQGRSALISRPLALQMTTPVVTVAPEVQTGLGTFVEQHHSAIYFGHDGLNFGFSAVARASLTRGEGAVIMTNGFAGPGLLLEILRSIAVEYAWEGWLAPPITLVPLAPARLAELAGEYRAGSDRPLTIVVKGRGLETREPFGVPGELLPIAADTFVARADGTRFTFRTRESQRELVISAPGDEPTIFARVADNTSSPLSLLAAGRVDEALARYTQLRASQPADPTIAAVRFDELGRELSSRQLDFEAAIRLFSVELALYPQSVQAAAGLADASLRAGHRADAARYFLKAKTLLAHDPPLSELALLYLRATLNRLAHLGLATP